ncbi:hypothetical protein GUITHDRAFT_109498 [Guillardia theta CCMP2712]|uniref:Uncharacterized protein n=1 Tax=Guillardia theta (strain CCMP2712) TaxID=905079 RepID=L1J9E2_GUITC|nr:hypothetical protein GUITHDRAFT_109498 [Guillardia theta CCMP2712]EKX44719.1 hypothetical protein GUITHDRAFT_109498 [Guillardia theta CCMP2712]|eukprot:XP_005831699.1 hypothetical protein GUITHDRAFT_109498 [Guillardia theta CCMP2712]
MAEESETNNPNQENPSGNAHMENEDRQKYLQRLERKIQLECERTKARAERFGVEYIEPKVETILSLPELFWYKRLKNPEQDYEPELIKNRKKLEEMDNNPPEMPSEAPVVGEALDPDYEIRDREYTEKLLEKVAQAYRSARARAERFNIPFTEPRLDVILTKTEFRKYMSATGGRNPLAAEAAPVAGIDTLTDEEKARQKARAERFKALAEAEGLPFEDPISKEEEAEQRKKEIETRAAKFGIELNAFPYGEDLGVEFCCPRRDPKPEEEEFEVLKDTLHCYGVDRLSTDEIMKNGITYPVLIRQATSLDKKDGKAQKSKRLWLKRRGAMPPPPRPSPEQQQIPSEPAPVIDLRDTLGKIRERKSKRQAARSHPYKKEDEEKEVHMMDSEEADRIMNAAAGDEGGDENVKDAGEEEELDDEVVMKEAEALIESMNE